MLSLLYLPSPPPTSCPSSPALEAGASSMIRAVLGLSALLQAPGMGNLAYPSGFSDPLHPHTNLRQEQLPTSRLGDPELHIVPCRLAVL